MTTPQRRPVPVAVSMRRWLCAWLALLVLLQVAASALAGLHGSLHRHRAGAAASAPGTGTLALRWTHAAFQAAHEALHARGEPHAHDLREAGVAAASDVTTDALAQLAVAVAPALTGADPAPTSHARHARPRAPTWWASSRALAPPLKPPRT